MCLKLMNNLQIFRLWHMPADTIIKPHPNLDFFMKPLACGGFLVHLPCCRDQFITVIDAVWIHFECAKSRDLLVSKYGLNLAFFSLVHSLKKETSNALI